ncbi:fibrillin-2-like [Sycon ciliatum]|uniref:fibrillin-2-like n=1 Tax=Sycon ciliatum TaxID=27933 RepID=UPI0031F6ED4C
MPESQYQPEVTGGGDSDITTLLATTMKNTSPTMAQVTTTAATATNNSCSPSPCMNGGTCIEDSGGGYNCSCVTGFTGRNCDINVTCPVPLPPNNGLLPGGNLTYGSNLTVSCIEGYALAGVSVVECGPTGVATNISGTLCSNIDECTTGVHNCSSDATCTDTDGGFLCRCSPGHYGPGTTCEECRFTESNVASVNTAGKVVCNNAFTRIQGSAVATCPVGSTTGTWENVGDCQALCSMPIIKAGEVNATQVTVSGSSAELYSTAVYSCNEGYRLSSGVNNTRVNCSVVNGSAVFHSAPTCQDIDECSPSSVNDCDSSAACTNTVGSFTCSCNAGYHGNGTTCRDIDECSPSGVNDCHSSAACTNTVGSFTCSCNAGFHGNGTTCRACGFTESNVAGIDSTGNVTCSNGYTRVQGIVAVASCPVNSTTGNWEGVGECQALCSMPSINEGEVNATQVTVSGSSAEFYSTAAYSCNEGYRLSSGVSNTRVNCSVVSESANFHGPPTCQDINECSPSSVNDCDSSAACTNTVGSFTCSCNAGYHGNGTTCRACGFIESNVAGIDSTGNVTCSNGYTRVQGIVAVASCPVNSTTGNWEGVGECQALCSMPSIKAGEVYATQVTVSDSSAELYSTAVYSCNEGYRLSSGVSNTTVNCSVVIGSADFRSAPTCQACQVSGTGHKVSSVSVSGIVTCDAGYYYNGTQPVCEDQSPNWQSLVSCKACKIPIGKFIDSITSSGAVTCVTGYENTPSQAATTCTNAAGVWQNASTCTIKTCIISAPANGSASPLPPTINYNQQVNYSCHTGFRLVGEKSSECDASGSLTAAQPMCQDINECGNTTLPDDDCHHDALCTNTPGSFGCSCNSGYTGNGTYCENINECVSGHECDTNANCTDMIGTYRCDCVVGYNGTGRSCTIVTCQKPAPPSKAIVSPGTFTYNQQLNFSCQIGYTLQGSGHVLCQDNGQPTNYATTACAALCSKPTIPHGSVEATQVIVSGSSAELYSTAMYSCNEGYRLSSGVSNTTVNCSVVIGKASFHSAPTCQACQIGGSGHKISSVSDSGTVTCDTGYNYSGTQPVCEDQSLNWQNLKSCQDIDECSPSGVNDCDSSAACTNTVGSFTCSCNAGFHGNGTTCRACGFTESNVAGINSTGKVTCSNGYTRVQGDVALATCPVKSATGNWEGVGECQALCSMPSISQGEVNATQVTVSDSSAELYSTAVYSCNKGYRLSSGVNNTRVNCSVVNSSAVFHSAPSCQDIDECGPSGVNDCHSSAACTNTVGSFTCSCNAGFHGNGTTCRACGFTESNVAGIDSTGNVTCSNGYTRVQGIVAVASCPVNSTTGNWEGVGECQALCNMPSINEGEVNATQVTVSGSSAELYSTAVYSCNEGYRLSRGVSNTRVNCSVVSESADFHGPPTCQDINECSPSSVNDCDSSAACTNTVGSFTCSCNAGYHGNGTTCRACGFTESNVAGIDSAGKVTCSIGYTRVQGIVAVASCPVNSATGNWEGVGECQALCNMPSISQGEVNATQVTVSDSSAELYSTAVYSCNEGYRLSSRVSNTRVNCSVVSGSADFHGPPTCQDIDECSTSGVNDCDSSAACTNTVGSFTCSCNAGFHGNGTTCRALCNKPSISEGEVNATKVTVSGSSAELYSTAVYNCNQGYRLSSGVSNTRLNCTVVNGSADFYSAPTCQACQVGGSGHRVSSVSVSGIVTCDAGYYYNGMQPVCEDHLLTWQSLASCQACNIPLGKFIDSITSSGVVTCVIGYENTPSQAATTCTNAAGVWQNAPTCTIKTCQISAPANGNASPLPPTINYNQQVNYSCHTGFRLVGEKSSECDASGSLTTAQPVCQDINECDNTTLHDCHHDALCTDTPGSFGCSCNSGYTGNGTYCTNINECVSGHECDTNANCTDMIGTYRCDCVVGYNGTGRSCTIVTCQKPAPPRSSTVSPGTFTYNQRLNFSCQIGYTLQGSDHVLCQDNGQPTNYSTTTCADDDECALKTHACSVNAACSNNDGSYACACNPGYTGNGTNCQDIDECSSNPCQNGTCHNLVDLYQCRCHPGFAGTECQTNIDECANSLCQNGATCQDGINQYTCTCLPGYTSTFCQTDIDECSTSPCLNGATCADRVNSYSCTCATGYQGTTCDININECAPNPCGNGGTCSDGVANYSCACNPGYTGRNCSVDIDECASNPCQNGASCTQGVNLYTCACVVGYTGLNCENGKS